MEKDNASTWPGRRIIDLPCFWINNHCHNSLKIPWDWEVKSFCLLTAPLAFQLCFTLGKHFAPECMSIVKVQLCFLYYPMKNNQKNSVNFWLKKLHLIIFVQHMSYHIIFSFFSFFVESLFSSCTSIKNLFCKWG